MNAIFERFSGNRQMRDLDLVGQDVILIPRRDLFSGEIRDYMRFDKTRERVNGMILYRQSAASMEVQIENRGEIKTITVKPVPPDDPALVVGINGKGNVGNN